MNGKPYDAMLHEGVTFHGVKLNQPDWGYYSHSLAIHFHGQEGDCGFYLIANAYYEALDFELPHEITWQRIVDTSLSPPEDIVEDEETAPVVREGSYHVAPRSVVLLKEAQGQAPHE
jgi:glycogen operon protein